MKGEKGLYGDRCSDQREGLKGEGGRAKSWAGSPGDTAQGETRQLSDLRGRVDALRGCGR